jgi:hypothetical protein
MPTPEFDLSRRDSVAIAVRMPLSLAEQLREAANATGVNLSTYVRDALLGLPAITEASVHEIQHAAARAERALIASEMRELRERLDVTLKQTVRAHEQRAMLEREVERFPVRLLILVNRILSGQIGARHEFAELWSDLDSAE